MKPFRFIQILTASALLFAAVSSYSDYSKHPEPLRTRGDISRASAMTDNVWISELSINDYPALAKFTDLKRVHFHTQDGSGADDQKLLALSRAGLTNLFDIDLLNCPSVTDRGIEHLARLPALRFLQLEGTSVSDDGCKVLASKRSVTGVNVANCTNVTLKGITELAHSDTLDELSFSFRNLTQQDVLRVIAELRHAKWCKIVDSQGMVDSDAVKRAGNARDIKIVLDAQGALRNLLGEKPRSWSPKPASPQPGVAVVAQTLKSYKVHKTTYADFERDVGLTMVERAAAEIRQGSPNLPNTQPVYGVPKGSPWKIYKMNDNVTVINGKMSSARKIVVGDVNRAISNLTFDGNGVLTDISSVP